MRWFLRLGLLYGIIDANPDDVAEIVNVFEADWKRVAPSVSNPNLGWSPVNARQRLPTLIDDAKQNVEKTGFGR
jgi:hypothetical protein